MRYTGIDMKTFWKGFAYFCIGTTPIQVVMVIWAFWVVVTTDYGIISLSHISFFENYFTFILPIVDWLYSWLWNDFLDFIFALPIIITQSIKAILSTWLGFWILSKLNSSQY